MTYADGTTLTIDKTTEGYETALTVTLKLKTVAENMKNGEYYESHKEIIDKWSGD